MTTTVFADCRVLDEQGLSEELLNVVVEGSIIQAIGHGRAAGIDNGVVLHCGGRTLMPGLIDAHAHVTAVDLDPAALRGMPLTLMTCHAARILHDMLHRGFTTIRDAHGADWGLRDAVERGFLAGPRMRISGAAISQTGGHGDRRLLTDDSPRCGCSSAASFVHARADGVPAVRALVRHQLRSGADQVKALISGGVANDPIENCYFSAEELSAIVEEATAANKYVLAHCYTSRAVRHAVACGVRCIEHGNLIDAETAQVMAAAGTYLVPTLIAYEAVRRRRDELGLPDASLRKLETVLAAGFSALESCKAVGVQLGFGTDLQGVLHAHQLEEFVLRAQVETPLDVIKSATTVNARLMGLEGQIGVIADGADADLLVVDGDPTRDLNTLVDSERHLMVIMQRGRFVRNRLAA